jgi:hypothetical protein
MRYKLRPSAVKTELKLRFGRCKRNTQGSLAAANRSSAALICRRLLSRACRPLRVSGNGREAVQRTKGRRRRLHHPEKLSAGTAYAL